MIPRLPAAKHREGRLAAQLRAAGFTGDVELDAATSTVYATDNSIYQVPPVGVVFPRGAEDISLLMRVLARREFADLAIAPRGGGTGTNGQSLTPGMAIDCSRHMNRIIDIDPVRRVARVEAGVVKDQLNQALKPHGLFFAPELSTSNRATIGGMIATDACGQGSCLYGKTSNHVLGLRIVLADGSEHWSRPLDADALEIQKARPDQLGDIHRRLERIVREKRDEIAAIFPRLNRFMTGYDLAHVLREDGHFDLNAILCGSEGTLAIVAEAELNLLPIPRHAALISIRYDDFNAALEDARSLAGLGVASVETIDEKVLSLAKGDLVWPAIAPFFPDDGGQQANGINIVEVVADESVDLAAQLATVTELLDGPRQAGRRGYTLATEAEDIVAIWSMRKRAVGLLGRVEGPARPVAFVEDTAVPPENLAAYIREFRALLDQSDLAYGMFGHVDAGVLHVRPALDLTRQDHQAMVRRISDAVVALTRKYGGVLWGEHGKGMRSEYVPDYFGPLYPSLVEIKRAFDPDNRLNPGKIATPADQALLKIDRVPLRGSFDRAIAADIRAGFGNANQCNGNGACFDFHRTSPMCPSFKATGDRRYSPKGRASLMREWLRRLAERGVDPRQEAEALRRSGPMAGLLRRLWNSLDPRNRDDFSHEVRAAMDTCLACKACAGQCPVQVSVPVFRSQFFELYYGRYLRPLRHGLIGAIETLLPLLARVRPIYNAGLATGVGTAAMRAVGLVALPRLAERDLVAAARLQGVALARVDELKGLSPEERQHTVVFVVDAFTAHFDPGAALAAFALAKKLGLRPCLAPLQGNGKPEQVHGYLRRFAAKARRVARLLDGFAEVGVTLVGLDPSMTLTYRSEYGQVPGLAMKAKVLLPQEWLAAHLNDLAARGAAAPAQAYRLLLHCTERTNAPAASGQWQAIFGRLGIALAPSDTGCCGMAGTFGHEADNRAMSEKLYAMSWKLLVDRAAAGEIVMATGYSCRSQAKQIDGIRLPHPLEVIDALIG